MLDFSGTNRGYGYAHYATLSGAANAIKVLNKHEIRPGHQIGVLKSKNNCRLLFGNIRPNVTFELFDNVSRKLLIFFSNPKRFSFFKRRLFFFAKLTIIDSRSAARGVVRGHCPPLPSFPPRLNLVALLIYSTLQKSKFEIFFLRFK